MANFFATLFKLTGPVNYSFWEIHIKSTLVLIIYPRAVFTTEDMLNTLVLHQTTNMNKVTGRNFLGF